MRGVSADKTSATTRDDSFPLTPKIITFLRNEPAATIYISLENKLSLTNCMHVLVRI